MDIFPTIDFNTLNISAQVDSTESWNDLTLTSQNSAEIEPDLVRNEVSTELWNNISHQLNLHIDDEFQTLEKAINYMETWAEKQNAFEEIEDVFTFNQELDAEPTTSKEQDECESPRKSKDHKLSCDAVKQKKKRAGLIRKRSFKISGQQRRRFKARACKMISSNFIKLLLIFRTFQQTNCNQ